jgi:signal transduction histidine kinase/phage shock protein PspC (stress-responsive transcriptional regulator)
MKSYGAPRYTQYEYDYASSVYARHYLGDRDPYESAPIRPARLPLMRPQYGRWFAGVCKGISMHLGVSVGLIRLIAIASTFAFGAGVIAYIFLWLTVPVGDPVQQAYRLAEQQPISRSPLSHGNAPYANAPQRTHTMTGESQSGGIRVEVPSATENMQDSGESLEHLLKNAPKPALIALAGLVLIAVSCAMMISGIDRTLILPLLFVAIGIGVSWLRYNAKEGQLWTMLGGIVLIFIGYVVYVFGRLRYLPISDHPTWTFAIAGLALLVGAMLAIVPWIVALIRDLGTERALKEREEERADMTAHLHDGVLQTLALIQLHAADQQTVFSLARSQERELREWLYQERTTSDRSVNAGLKQIAALVEDTHGKPIEVVTVGDAQPSAQTDALLDATQQALINAVTHGAEPISVYCEAGENMVEVFVRDHGEGFDIATVPANRLGIRESIIGRIKRRGGTVEIVSRPKWGTEVRMHMPIAAERPRTGKADADQAKEQQ